MTDSKKTLDEKCWKGYKKKGMKTMFGKRYPNCVKKKKTRKEEYSDWRSALEEKKEPKLPKTKGNVKSLNMVNIKPGDTFASLGARAKGMVSRVLGGIDTPERDQVSKDAFSGRKKSKKARIANVKAYKDFKAGGPPKAKGLAKLGKGIVKGISKTPKGALAAGALFGGVAAAREIGRKFNEIRKKRKDAAIDRQVDKYVADRKIPGGPKKVNYKPTNQYTVKRDKDGKVTGTGDQIRVVPGTRTIKRMPKPGERTSTKSRFSQYTRMKLGNYGSLSPMDEKMDLKKADMGEVITDFRKSDAPQFKGKSDKKIQKMAIAAKLEADGKSLKDEYLPEILDKKDVPHIKKLIKKLKDGSELHAKQSKDLEKVMKEQLGGTGPKVAPSSEEMKKKLNTCILVVMELLTWVRQQ